MPAHGEVPLQPIREAFLRSGRTYREIVHATGMDESQVARLLGAKPSWAYRSISTGRRRYGPYQQRTVSYENAVRLCLALGVSPVEVDV